MEFNTKKWRGAAGLIVLGAALYWAARDMSAVTGFLALLWRLAFPLVLGGCIAFVLNLPMRAIEKKLWPKKAGRAAALRRPLSLLGAIAFICAVLGAVVALVVPELTDAIRLLAEQVPLFLQKVTAWAQKNAEMFPAAEEWLMTMTVDWNKIGRELLSAVGSGAAGVLDGTVSLLSRMVSSVVDFVVALIFALYILLSKETLNRQLKRIFRAYLPERAEKLVLHVAATAHRIFASFISGQCIEAVILGSLCAVGMLALRLPYAPMVGALVGVTALIPVVGAFIGASVGVFMIMMQDPVKALVFLAFLLILQQVEGNLIYPRVVGASVGLPALWVLAAVTVGGSLGGVTGMLFAVPMASVCYALLRENVAWNIAKKQPKPADMPAESAGTEEKQPETGN